jgi:hypothetical protein
MFAERNPGCRYHHPLAAGTSTIMQVQAHATQVRTANWLRNCVWDFSPPHFPCMVLLVAPEPIIIGSDARIGDQMMAMPTLEEVAPQ